MTDEIPAEELFKAQKTCNNCGRCVSDQFARVYGFGGEVDGCMDCMSTEQLRNGEAAQK